MYKYDKFECAVVVRHGSGNSGESRSIKTIPCYPEEVQSSVAASWNEQTVVGRVGSLRSYTGTSDVTSNFSFDLHRDMNISDMNNSTYSDQFGKDVDELTRVLKSGCYPQYGENLLHPPRTLFRFGDMYISGVLTDFSITWKKPIINKAYALCTVSITMKSADKRIISYEDVISGERVTTRGHMPSGEPLYNYLT